MTRHTRLRALLRALLRANIFDAAKFLTRLTRQHF